MDGISYSSSSYVYRTYDHATNHLILHPTLTNADQKAWKPSKTRFQNPVPSRKISFSPPNKFQVARVKSSRGKGEGKRIVFWQAVANSWLDSVGGRGRGYVRTRHHVYVAASRFVSSSPSEPTTATPTITNGIIYEFEHEPELLLSASR